MQTSSKKKARTICLDFDGVIHSYVSGWSGATNITDEPVPGAFEFIDELLLHDWHVAVLSARSHEEGGIKAMQWWMTSAAIEDMTRATNTWTGWRNMELNEWMAEVGHAIPLRSRLYEELNPGTVKGRVVGSHTMEDAIKKVARKFVRKIDFPTHKPPAILYIDDRAFCFEGTWPSMNFIQNFKPWNKV